VDFASVIRIDGEAVDLMMDSLPKNLPVAGTVKMLLQPLRARERMN